MPKLTENYKLKKPLGVENASINVVNENFDIIDEALTPPITDNTVPTSESTKGKLATAMAWFANRIKAITGKSHWYETPATNLETVARHIGARGISVHNTATSEQSGFMSPADKKKLDKATSSPTASTIILRDSSGRAKVVSPLSDLDIANKDYVDKQVSDYMVRNVSNIIATGVYTGNGEYTQEIYLDFTPRAVFVYPVGITITSQYGGFATKNQNAVISTGYATTYATEYDYHYVTVAITTTGFKVSYCSASSHSRTNYKGYKYAYAAFR